MTPIAFPDPVYSLAVKAKTKADEDKLGPALQKLAEEDPTFRTHRDPETSQTLMAGLGETHLDIVVERLKRKFGVEVETETPKIAYRETITANSGGPGPAQEADRWPRAVRRLLDQARAAAEGRGLRVCGRDRRRLDTAGS